MHLISIKSNLHNLDEVVTIYDQLNNDKLHVRLKFSDGSILDIDGEAAVSLMEYLNTQVLFTDGIKRESEEKEEG